MFYIRPIAREDLPAIFALSERTGAGLTTLPANRERRKSRQTVQSSRCRAEFRRSIATGWVCG